MEIEQQWSFLRRQFNLHIPESHGGSIYTRYSDAVLPRDFFTKNMKLKLSFIKRFTAEVRRSDF